MASFRRLFTVAALLITTGCGVRPLVTSKLTLEFNEQERAKVSVETTIENEASNEAMEKRVAAIRQDYEAARDEWSLRFAAAHPDEERLIQDRKGGELARIERIATFDRDRLPRFFSDSSMTVSCTSANGVTELTIIPGASARATRQQREKVLATLHSWSVDAAAYAEAIGNLYAWLDANPRRAETAFKLLLGDRDERSTVDEEQALVEGVWNAMDRLTERLRDSADALTVDEQFDLVFNPFPAEITVHVPHAFTLVENFTRLTDDRVTIRRAGLLDAVDSLDGRWISPDPLVRSLEREPPSPAALAAMPRKWTAVLTAAQIESAVTERLKPATVYRVRWNE